MPKNILQNASCGQVIKRTRGREIKVAVNERGEGTSKINLMTRFTSFGHHVFNTNTSELGTGACCYDILKIKNTWGSAIWGFEIF